MTTFRKTSLQKNNLQKTYLNDFGAQKVNLRHRYYSNSRLTTPTGSLLENNKLSRETKKNSEHKCTIEQSAQAKKYCFNRNNESNGGDKWRSLHKNRSLKILNRNNSHKFFNKTKLDQVVSVETLPIKGEQRSSNNSQKGKTVWMKRKNQLIKKNQNKLRINQKSVNKEQHEPKSDVSFGQQFQKIPQQSQRIATINKFNSENILSEGLKKCSSKRKILVKNPFQKLMRQCQLAKAAQIQTQTAAIIQQMQQSLIAQNPNQSFTSLSHRCQLQQMLAMI